MKKLLFIGLLLGLTTLSYGQEIKVITVIESIVPGGIGRSRIIEKQENTDFNSFTTTRTDGKKSKQGDVDRKDLKIENFDETKLLNFYSMAGINFQNIASNDAVISSKLTQMVQDGWKLVFVTSGTESNAGKDDKTGIFITRFIFQR